MRRRPRRARPPRARGTRASPSRREDLGDRAPACSRSISRVELDERHAEPAGELRVRRWTCPTPGIPTRYTITATSPGSARGCARVSGSESPPNFSSTAFASTNATAASPTTPPAGTAHTSVRCLIATAPVFRRQVHGRERLRHGRERLHRRADPDRLAGAHAALDPARARGPAGDRARRGSTISSCAFDPGRAAVANPSPTSTPFTDWMLISAAASRASSLRSQCT